MNGVIKNMLQSDIKTKNKINSNLKNKKNTYMLIAIGLVLILLSSVLLYSLISIREVEEEIEDLEPTVPITHLITKTYAELKEEGLLDYIDVVDDRISPYENQALIFEVLRIRHRGLLEKLLKPGLSWRIKPEFYFITEIDGAEYVSKDVKQHGRVTEVLFNTWDSMFQENKVVRNVEEEQETSEVTLTIVERERIGLLGLRTRDVKKDSFTVTYCYRTGRWTGDNYFGHPQGYGYYLGDTFEIWFNLYQPDFDNDYIPYWTEVNILGTDPTVDDSKLDPDGDGIPTYWEWKWGYDPFTWDDHANLDPDIDSLSNIQEYQLEKWFANPFIENIYVEVDYMEATGIRDPAHVFYEETKQGLIERFAQHNIKAFFDDGWPNTPPNGGGQELPHIERLSIKSGMILQYYNNYFPDERKGSFIYCVLGHRGAFMNPAKGNVYDTIFIWTIPFSIFSPIRLAEGFIGYGIFPTPRGVRIAQGAVLLHELGHVGGLAWGFFEGIDNTSYFHWLFPGKTYSEKWGNYRSVMNYAVMYRPDLLDFSHGQNGPPYDQDDWANFHLGGWSRTSLRIFDSYPRELDESEYPALFSWDQIQLDTERPPITGYVYDQNLTEAFERKVGDWSPNTRYNVEWEVHRLVEEEQYPHFRDIKVFVSPKDIASKYHHIWSLFMEGDFDSEGNIVFAHSIPFEILTLNYYS
jgi:hypothetical protein